MAEKTVFQKLAEEIGAGDSKIIPKIFATLVDEIGENSAGRGTARHPGGDCGEIGDPQGKSRGKDCPLISKGSDFYVP